MGIILVVDNDATFRSAILARLKLAGYRAVGAVDGHDALDCVGRQRPDLIVTDIVMPGIDGLTFLQLLRSNSATAAIPVILLTAHSERNSIARAGKLGVRDCLLKSHLSLKELLERIRKYLPGGGNEMPRSARTVPASAPVAASPVTHAAASRSAIDGKPVHPSTMPAQTYTTAVETKPSTSFDVPPQLPRLLTREACIERAEHALQARALSGVIAQVMAMAASPRGNMSDLAHLISRDPALAARVLAVANSTAYTANRGIVTTISDAVRNIGCSMIRNIAVGLGVTSAMPAESPDSLDLVRCWQHSFATGMLCEQLCLGIGPAETAVAYLTGLCHDLSEILFRTTFGEEYRQILLMQQQTGMDLDQVQRAMIGMSHTEMVDTILRCARLPSAIQTPIRQFHRHVMGLKANRTVLMLHMADAYANGALLANSGQSLVRAFLKTDYRQVTKQEKVIRPDPDQLRTDILCMTGVLAQLPAEQEAQLLAPLYPRKSARLWVACDSALSDFNPIIAALHSLVDGCTVCNHLPGPQEWSGHDGLVILARTATTQGFTAMEVAKTLDSLGNVPSSLWLVGRKDIRPVTSTPAPMPWPVSVDVLAKYVARVPQLKSAA